MLALHLASFCRFEEPSGQKWKFSYVRICHLHNSSKSMWTVLTRLSLMSFGQRVLSLFKPHHLVSLYPLLLLFLFSSYWNGSDIWKFQCRNSTPWFLCGTIPRVCSGENAEPPSNRTCKAQKHILSWQFSINKRKAQFHILSNWVWMYAASGQWHKLPKSW